MKLRHVVAVAAAIVAATASAQTQPPRQRVLAFFSEHTESDHVDFARQANDFFGAQAKAEGFEWVATTHWEDLNPTALARTSLVVWLDDEPPTAAERQAFQDYMEAGGAWLGFHVSAYNDRDSHWPWFVQFLGGAVFYGNNWPPLPADLRVEDRTSPVTSGLPATFRAPANEWYSWKPDPRDDKDVRVLLSLETSNYPLGLKDVISGGDVPVAWTNTRYRMLYLNAGHGDRIFTSPLQNRLLHQAVEALLAGRPLAATPGAGRKTTSAKASSAAH